MSHSLASKSVEELVRVGERICRCHDEQWVALWAYNIHRCFRSRLREREVWTRMDQLVRCEWDWHLGKELFHDIRKETIGADREKQSMAEIGFLCLGEIVAKSISNASWNPGLFDVDAPYRVPVIALRLSNQLGDGRLAEWLESNFEGILQHDTQG